MTPRGRFQQDLANEVIALFSNSAMICRQWFVETGLESKPDGKIPGSAKGKPPQ
jgi:hypothetical protein